jgi:hypothetical protein
MNITSPFWSPKVCTLLANRKSVMTYSNLALEDPFRSRSSVHCQDLYEHGEEGCDRSRKLNQTASIDKEGINNRSDTEEAITSMSLFCVDEIVRTSGNSMNHPRFSRLSRRLFANQQESGLNLEFPCHSRKWLILFQLLFDASINLVDFFMLAYILTIGSLCYLAMAPTVRMICDF